MYFYNKKHWGQCIFVFILLVICIYNVKNLIYTNWEAWPCLRIMIKQEAFLFMNIETTVMIKQEGQLCMCNVTSIMMKQEGQ